MTSKLSIFRGSCMYMYAGTDVKGIPVHHLCPLIYQSQQFYDFVKWKFIFRVHEREKAVARLFTSVFAFIIHISQSNVKPPA